MFYKLVIWHTGALKNRKKTRWRLGTDIFVSKRLPSEQTVLSPFSQYFSSTWVGHRMMISIASLWMGWSDDVGGQTCMPSTHGHGSSFLWNVKKKMDDPLMYRQEEHASKTQTFENGLHNDWRLLETKPSWAPDSKSLTGKLSTLKKNLLVWTVETETLEYHWLHDIKGLQFKSSYRLYNSLIFDENVNSRRRKLPRGTSLFGYYVKCPHQWAQLI